MHRNLYLDIVEQIVVKNLELIVKGTVNDVFVDKLVGQQSEVDRFNLLDDITHLIGRVHASKDQIFLAIGYVLQNTDLRVHLRQWCTHF